ncbi:hypothetical protein F53441_14447 [Fusarium austroafricanum]|uniref:Uncharacterized protein n=1 Tax=Fusarium austroafricanum TaxID=2364996 RepID=A0A8H4JD28_9HYPO|nr:hypothetical protein F53441_14447 [Fusarium austroafricanum]
MSSEQNITPTEWDSLRSDEAPTQTVAAILYRMVCTPEHVALDYNQVAEFRNLAFDRIGIQWIGAQGIYEVLYGPGEDFADIWFGPVLKLLELERGP